MENGGPFITLNENTGAGLPAGLLSEENPNLDPWEPGA